MGSLFKANNQNTIKTHIPSRGIEKETRLITRLPGFVSYTIII